MAHVNWESHMSHTFIYLELQIITALQLVVISHLSECWRLS